MAADIKRVEGEIAEVERELRKAGNDEATVKYVRTKEEQLRTREALSAQTHNHGAREALLRRAHPIRSLRPSHT